MLHVPRVTQVDTPSPLNRNLPHAKAPPGLALLNAAVQDGTQVGGFQGPLRYRLPRKF